MSTAMDSVDREERVASGDRVDNEYRVELDIVGSDDRVDIVGSEDNVGSVDSEDMEDLCGQ